MCMLLHLVLQMSFNSLRGGQKLVFGLETAHRSFVMIPHI
jgi:hypothetical protein